MHQKLFVTALFVLSAIFTLGQPHQPPPAPALFFSTTTIPAGSYGSNYKTVTLRVIGGKEPYSFAVSSGDLPSGISLSGDGQLSGTPRAAGSYSFTVSVQDHSRNNLSGSQDYTLTIDPAPLTVVVNNATMTYGSPVPSFTVSYRGFVNGDDASVLSSAPAVTTPASSSSAAGTYPVTASGAASSNYRVSYTPGVLTVNPASLQVTASAESKAFGESDPPLAYTVGGLVNGDGAGIVTGKLSRSPGENVGSYPISRGSITAGGNYSISYTGNNLTITRSSQHISWTQDLLVGCNSNTKITLNATASSGLPVTYSVSDPSVATVSGNVLNLLRPGKAIVTASQAGNANVGPAQTVNDTLSYEPVSLISQHWSDALFFDNSSGDYVAWQWYKDGQAVPGATDPFYSDTPTLYGQYYVIATNKNGQKMQTCTLTITRSANLAGGVKVRPNPASAGSVVTVTCNYPSAALQGAVLELMDINGRVLQHSAAVQSSVQMTMPSQSGIYIINLLLAGGQRVSTNVLVN
ncbi:MAG TPA: MBG domain-containing protein [Puia sp.]|nr:MBG domain-containing protein [Puia sp.]